MEISTNNVPRDLISAFELNTVQYNNLRKEFDYLDDEDFNSATFFQYRGEIYSLADFMRTEGDLLAQGWQGYYSWSYGAGMLVKIVDSCERVVVATYSC